MARQRYFQMMQQADARVNGQMFIHGGGGPNIGSMARIFPAMMSSLQAAAANPATVNNPHAKNANVYAMIGAHSQQDGI